MATTTTSSIKAQRHRRPTTSSPPSSSSTTIISRCCLDFTNTNSSKKHLFAVCLIVFMTTTLLFITNNNNQNYLLQPSSSNRFNGVQCSSLTVDNNPNRVGGQNRCPAGWLWFNNKCWVASNSRRNFLHAIELCRKMYFNSTLPTIHSEEENEFLRNNIELDSSPIWLYSRHNHQYNRTRWLDKSPVNYTRWDNGQPSDKSSLVCIKTEDNWYMKKAEPVDGQTECVSFWADAKWGTQVGCQVLLPVVCEMKLPPVKRNNESTTSAELITPYYSSASSLMDNQPILVMTLTYVSIIVTVLPRLNFLSTSTN